MLAGVRERKLLQRALELHEALLQHFADAKFVTVADAHAQIVRRVDGVQHVECAAHEWLIVGRRCRSGIDGSGRRGGSGRDIGRQHRRFVIGRDGRRHGRRTHVQILHPFQLLFIRQRVGAERRATHTADCSRALLMLVLRVRVLLGVGRVRIGVRVAVAEVGRKERRGRSRHGQREAIQLHGRSRRTKRTGGNCAADEAQSTGAHSGVGQ